MRFGTMLKLSLETRLRTMECFVEANALYREMLKLQKNAFPNTRLHGRRLKKRLQKSSTSQQTPHTIQTTHSTTWEETRSFNTTCTQRTLHIILHNSQKC